MVYLLEDFILGKVLGSEIVKFTVGEGKRTFFLHKQLLCDSVAYFKAAFAAGGFKESEESTIDMPKDDPEVFEIFVHWLYRETVPAATTAQYFEKLLDLYIFAEKLCMDAVADTTIDAIQDSLEFLGEIRSKNLAQIDKIWRNTSSASPLRKWLIHTLVYDAWDAWDEDESNHPIVLKPEVLASLGEIFKDHPDLYTSFFTQVRENSSDDHLEGPPNPYDPCAWDLCHFHRHPEGVVCHATE